MTPPSLAIKREDIFKLIQRLKEQTEVIAPVKSAEDDFFFQPIQSVDEVALDYPNSVTSPREFVFPSTEALFRFSYEKGYHLEPIIDARPQIIFGIRCCDVSGIRFLDRFFSLDFPDNYYFARRNNTTLISIGCSIPPWEQCFCICADTGPFLESGFDIQLTDLNGKYLVEMGSERGKLLTEAHRDLFGTPTKSDLEQNQQIRATVDQKFTTKSYFAKGILEITKEQVPEELWIKFADKCVSCGGCLYMCPTCSCFNVFDITSSEGGMRLRCWDTCIFSGFTRLVSGENPREAKPDRVRRRFYHKLSYYYMEKNLMHGCVGCGRCTAACPVKLGMPTVVERMRREE